MAGSVAPAFRRRYGFGASSIFAECSRRRIYELVDKQPVSMMDWDTEKLGKQHSVRRLELNSP